MAALLLLLQDALLGDPLDIRSTLRERGVTWVLAGTVELYSDVHGGLDPGTEAECLLDWVIDADLEKLAGWTGASARANPMGIEGHGLTREHTGDLTKVSNIDARDSLRLFEAWLQQGVGFVNVRAGILAADQEFALSESAALFANGTFGLPVLLTLNAPVSAYPLGALGARLRVEPAPGVHLMAALYEGSPDVESVNRSGAEIRLHHDEGLLWLGEAGWQHATGVLKAGAFEHSGDFLHHSSGLYRRGHHGGYVVVEQKVAAGFVAFLRAGAAPERNSLVARYVEAGVVCTGLIPGREADQLGLAWVRAELSDDIPGARYESLVEVTLKIVVTRWLALQPDVQFLRHPGGFGVIDDATVVGLRLDVFF